MINLILPELSDLTKHNFNLEKLPEKQGVYFLFNEKNELLYVGATANLKSRMRGHKSAIKCKTSYIKEPVTKVSTLIDFQYNNFNIFCIEAIYISFYQPKFNDRRGPHSLINTFMNSERQFTLEERLQTAEETSLV